MFLTAAHLQLPRITFFLILILYACIFRKYELFIELAAYCELKVMINGKGWRDEIEWARVALGLVRVQCRLCSGKTWPTDLDREDPLMCMELDTEHSAFHLLLHIK